MRSSGSMYGGGAIRMPPVPRLTRVLIGVFVGLSVFAAILGPWGGAVDLWTLLRFNGGEVLAGQVWKLVTYAWLTDGVLGLVFGLFGFVFFVGQLEIQWGRKLFVRRVATLVVAPVFLLTLLSAVSPAIGARTVALGPSMLIMAALTAFASELRGRTIMLFPLPFQLTGDTILWLQGGLLGLSVLFAGQIIEFLPPIFSFAIALAWFRLDLTRDLRRILLKNRRRRLARKLQRTKASHRGHLRVVSSDDDEKKSKDKRYLH